MERLPSNQWDYQNEENSNPSRSPIIKGNQMKNYFVMYETETIVNSFLVCESSSAEEAWDEAVDRLKNDHSDESPVITKFYEVK